MKYVDPDGLKPTILSKLANKAKDVIGKVLGLNQITKEKAAKTTFAIHASAGTNGTINVSQQTKLQTIAPTVQLPQKPEPSLKEYFNKIQCGEASTVANALKAIGAAGTIGSVHTALDVAGLVVPGVGMAFDGLNAILYLTQGDKVNAGLSAMSMIPVAGYISKTAKVAKVVSKPAGKVTTGIIYKASKSLKKLSTKGSANLVSSVKWKGFSKGQLAEHYKKHVVDGKEFGDISQTEYLNQAKSFAAQVNTTFKERQVGNFAIKYDPATRRVLIGNIKDREVRTFYKADSRDDDPFLAAIELAKKISGTK